MNDPSDLSSLKRAASKGQHSCDGKEELVWQMADSLPAAVWLQDAYTGDILYVNAAYARIWGRPVEMLYQDPTSFLDAVHPEDRQAISLIFPGPAGLAVRGEFRILRPDGSVAWVACVTSSIRDGAGEVCRISMVAEDITLRKATEAAEKARMVELARQRAELDAFAHTVAHNLKNPLGLILGNARLLIDTLAPLPLDTSDTESLYDIVMMAEKANQIIDNLLLLSTTDTCGVISEPLVMEHLVANVLKRLQPLMHRVGARVRLPAAWPLALGYAPWVEEVWVNYLDNALKYGGPQPRIDLGALVLGDGTVRFYVRDHGPGIAESDLARLYNPFTRLEGANGDGTGLGLAIVRRIVERLGGEVAVTSTPGQGSTFSFTLAAVEG